MHVELIPSTTRANTVTVELKEVSSWRKPAADAVLDITLPTGRPITRRATVEIEKITLRTTSIG